MTITQINTCIQHKGDNWPILIHERSKSMTTYDEDREKLYALVS